MLPDFSEIFQPIAVLILTYIGLVRHKVYWFGMFVGDGWTTENVLKNNSSNDDKLERSHQSKAKHFKTKMVVV